VGDEQQNPFLIPPPPGGFPEKDQPREPASESATLKVPAGRAPVAFRPAPAPGSIPPPAAPVAPAPAAAPAPAPPAPATAPAEPAAPPVSTAPATNETPRVRAWQLTAPDGAVLTVTGTMVAGRRPTAPASAPTATPLALDDPTKTVSKTHALLEAGVDTLSVVDLGSTNGVKLARAGERDRILQPGSAEAAIVGDVLHLGDLVLRVGTA